jgi:hypothetical protein
MQVEGGGMDWFVLFKNVNFGAPIKTTDLVPPWFRL